MCRPELADTDLALAVRCTGAGQTALQVMGQPERKGAHACRGLAEALSLSIRDAAYSPE